MSQRMLHPQTQKSHFDLSRGIAALGRGPDSQLVHMSNKEVDGLQKLAMAAGGSLTRNPHTGLLEAGWLDSILPTIAGGVLAATGVGAPAAGLIVGAADAAINHKTAFMSGLTAGLGAYGGANIASGIAGVGAQSTADQAASAATNSSLANDPAAATPTDSSGLQPMEGPSGIATDTTPATSVTPTQDPNQVVATTGKNGQLKFITSGQAAQQAATSGIRANEASSVSNGFTGQQFGQGLRTLAGGSDSMTSSQALGDVAANSGKYSLMEAAAPAMYQSYLNQQQIPAKPTYPLYKEQYNRGTQNPHPGPGQLPILGQGYSTPIYMGNYRHGGSIKHYDTGGISTTLPAGTAQAAQTLTGAAQPNQAAPQATPLTPTNPQQAALIQQYQNQITQGQQQQAQQVHAAPPSGDWTNYLQNLNNSFKAPPTSGGIANGTTNSPNPSGTSQTPAAGIPSLTGNTPVGTQVMVDPSTGFPVTDQSNSNTSGPNATAQDISSPDYYASQDNGSPPSQLNVVPSNAGTYNPLKLIGAGLNSIGFNTTAGIATGLGNATNYISGLTPSQQANATYNNAQTNATNDANFTLDQSNPGGAYNDIASQPFINSPYVDNTGISADGTTTGTYVTPDAAAPAYDPSQYDYSQPFYTENTNDNAGGSNYLSSTGIYGSKQGGQIKRYAPGGLTALSQGRLLKGPGDGMSDSIPAQIVGGNRPPEPAALGDGEFVVPADVVSHLGNGSTEAGSKRLYQMMDRIRQARTGKKAQAPQVNAQGLMPA